MFRFFVIQRGVDGAGNTVGAFWDLLLMPAENTGNSQIFCGTSASYAAAKTLGAAIVKASLTWDDTAHESAIFTT